MKAVAVVETLDMEYEDWLKYRQTGIGGSDAGAICGLNPWCSPISVYLDKIGLGEEVEDNERMRIGRDLEDYVAKRFEEATGFKVRRRNALLQHPKYKFMNANVDRLVVGKKEGLECKTTNSYAKSDWKEGIPPHYEMQCHHYMAVTGYKAWWIACLIGNEEFIYKKINRDEDIINYLIQIEKNFWENNVLKKLMPAPDGSDDASNALKMLYPDSKSEESIFLEDEYLARVQRRDEIEEMLKNLKKEKKKIEQEVQKEMKDAEVAYLDKRKITWKTVVTNRFNSNEFKKDYPALYEEYTKRNSYRRFSIK